jgi:NDP-sugar pyrophosphorylase family protein
MTRTQVAILAGGLGTRIGSMVNDRNKVAASINGRPFIFFILDLLCASNVERVVICSGYKGDDLAARIGNHYKTIELIYSKEQKPLGTAGALRLALPHFADHTIIAMNGDSYLDLDLRDLITYHRKIGSKTTIASVWVEDASRYGKLEIDSQNRVKAFLEKQNECHAGYINAGIYVLEPQMLVEIPEGIPFSLEHEIFPQWANKRLYAYRHKGTFIDIGIPESYMYAQEHFKSKESIKRIVTNKSTL